MAAMAACSARPATGAAPQAAAAPRAAAALAAAAPPRRRAALACLPSCRPSSSGLASSSPASSISRSHPQQRQRRRLLPRSAAASGAAGQAGEEEGEEPPPSAEELQEAERVLQDFLEGMGAAGEVQRPGDADLPSGRMSWAEAVSLMGARGWRLSGKLCPEVEELVAQVEGCWRGTLPEDQFGLVDMEQRFKYMDSLDPSGVDPLSFMSRADPDKGQPGYPRLQVENRAYWSRAFRKLHIEVAVRQDGLQVFHCVMFPRVTYDLPILSMDLVANNGRVSLAVIDPCPVSPSLQLPPFYEAPVRQLQERYALESNREVPAWGAAIFSPLCVIMRPQSGDDVGRFLKYALALTQMHVEIAKIAHPVTSGPGSRRRVEALHAAHQRYCDKQLENDKTRRVLEAAFGGELAEAYMRQVMFDVEPLPAEV